MNYMKRCLLAGEDPRVIHECIEELRERGEAGDHEAREKIAERLGLTRAEWQLFERDPDMFFRYLETTQATRRGGCG